MLTFDVFDTYSLNGRRSKAMRYINVDNARRYLWHSQIKGGFKNKDVGCIYFVPNSKLVLSIETFTEEQIEQL
jgi:hypothetical protein